MIETVNLGNWRPVVPRCYAGARTNLDVVGVRPAAIDACAEALRSARGSQGNPAILSTPPFPGRYQLRYRATDSGEVLHEIEIEVRA